MCKYLGIYFRFCLTFYTLFRLLPTFLPKLLHILRNRVFAFWTYGFNLLYTHFAMSKTIKIANASIHDIATAFANSSAVITLIVPLFLV